MFNLNQKVKLLSCYLNFLIQQALFLVGWNQGYDLPAMSGPYRVFLPAFFGVILNAVKPRLSEWDFTNVISSKTGASYGQGIFLLGHISSRISAHQLT